MSENIGQRRLKFSLKYFDGYYISSKKIDGIMNMEISQKKF